jgi:hypothetical protein
MSEAEVDQLDEQEIARRRDEVLKRLLQTPPKRHEEMKLGKPRRLRGGKTHGSGAGDRRVP